MNQHLHDLIDELEAKVVAELHHLEDAVRAEFGDLVARFRHHANETAPQAAQEGAGDAHGVEAVHTATERPAALAANAAGHVAPLGFRFVGEGPDVVPDGFSPPAPVPPAGYGWNEAAQAYSPVAPA